MSSPAGRISMGTAFRQAFHPVDVRADLAALPWLVTHTYALWVPIAITVVGGIAVAVANDPRSITSLMYEYFVRPPAIGGVFIAGFLAPRASWLLGLIVGLVSALVNALLVTFVPARDLLDRPGRGPGAGVHRDGLPALADLRGAVRLGCRVVSPVPAAVEPEPRPASRGEEEGERRQVAYGRQGPEGRRPPLTSCGAAASGSAQPAHPRVTQLSHALGTA